MSSLESSDTLNDFKLQWFSTKEVLSCIESFVQVLTNFPRIFVVSMDVRVDLHVDPSWILEDDISEASQQTFLANILNSRYKLDVTVEVEFVFDQLAPVENGFGA